MPLMPSKGFATLEGSSDGDDDVPAWTVSGV